MLAEDTGRIEQRAGYPLARGVDVQLTLEDVIDDWLGQVIHNMAVPMLQGQPVEEETTIKWTSRSQRDQRSSCEETMWVDQRCQEGNSQKNMCMDQGEPRQTSDCR